MHGILLTALIAMAVGAVLCFILLPYHKRTKALAALKEAEEIKGMLQHKSLIEFRRMQRNTKSEPLEKLARREHNRRRATIYAAALGGPEWKSQYLSRTTPA